MLRHLRLKNTVVTADAAHAQSVTASRITAQGGDYLLTVKANQPGTQQAIRGFLEPILAATPEGHYQTVDKARHSIEPRRCWLRTDLEDFVSCGQWSGLGAVALLETRCENITTGKITIEQRCCITSLGVPADTTPAATPCLAILRKITFKTLKVHAPFPGKKGEAMSIRSGQYVASISPNYLASLSQNPALTP